MCRWRPTPSAWTRRRRCTPGRRRVRRLDRNAGLTVDGRVGAGRGDAARCVVRWRAVGGGADQPGLIIGRGKEPGRPGQRCGCSGRLPVVARVIGADRRPHRGGIAAGIDEIVTVALPVWIVVRAIGDIADFGCVGGRAIAVGELIAARRGCISRGGRGGPGVDDRRSDGRLVPAARNLRTGGCRRSRPDATAVGFRRERPNLGGDGRAHRVEIETNRRPVNIARIDKRKVRGGDGIGVATVGHLHGGAGVLQLSVGPGIRAECRVDGVRVIAAVERRVEERRRFRHLRAERHGAGEIHDQREVARTEDGLGSSRDGLEGAHPKDSREERLLRTG